MLQGVRTTSWQEQSRVLCGLGGGCLSADVNVCAGSEGEGGVRSTVFLPRLSTDTHRSSPTWAPAPCVSCRPWSAPTLPPSAMSSFTLPTAWKFLGELPWNMEVLPPVSPAGLCTMSGSGVGGGNFLRLVRGQDTGPSWRLHSSSRFGSRAGGRFAHLLEMWGA